MHISALLLLAGSTAALTDIEHKPFMRKNIDPIVLPGKYKSHMHSFYGSDSINKTLPTTADLQKGCPSGENPNDLSIYCTLHPLLPFPIPPAKQKTKTGAPTLYYVNGETYTEIYPSTFKTYYENIDSASIPFPPNFHSLAGNASAKSQSDINEKINALTWWCDAGPEDRDSRPRATFPRVTCAEHMQVILRFPDCVDAELRYAYAAANGGSCPAGMKRMPSLRFSVRYDTKTAIPGGWKGVPPFKLACGEVSFLFFHHNIWRCWCDVLTFL